MQLGEEVVALKSNYAELNRIDELFALPDSPAKTALLQLRSANFDILKCRAESSCRIGPQVDRAADLRDECLRIGGELVSYYLPIIDKADELGI